MSHTSLFPPLPSPAEMRALDTRAIAEGTPVLELMERAGIAVLGEIERRYGKKMPLLILCGPGNNGGDGLVMARKAKEKGVKANVILAGSEKYSDECKAQIEKARGAAIEIKIFGESALEAKYISAIGLEELQTLVSGASVVVDALLGTGQKAEARGMVAEIAKILRGYKTPAARVVAIDVPTGVNADTGEIFELHIDADMTVCMEFKKRGLLQYPAREIAGEIVRSPIGIADDGGVEFSEIVPAILSGIPARAGDIHKGTAGRVFVIGGSKNFPGAPLLSAHAALRMGSGLVTRVALDQVDYPNDWPEIMRTYVPGVDGRLCSADIEALSPMIERSKAIVFGPGLSSGDLVHAATQHFLEIAKDKKTVIDADGLNALAALPPAAWEGKLSQSVLTPHPGEAARLLNTTIETVQRDRYHASRELAARTGATVVLKGAGSIVYAEGHGYVCSIGNPFMATAGSGDVLSGMIASLLGQGASPLVAAACGVWIHARAGDEAYRLLRGPLIASDIIQQIPRAISL